VTAAACGHAGTQTHQAHPEGRQAGPRCHCRRGQRHVAPPGAEDAASAKATGSKSRSGAAKASTTKASAAKGGAKRGRKPAAAKGDDDAFDDVDLTDDLDDALIDDEVEAVADDPTDSAAEAAEKAKPLRMKLSKAKERALMKEFGLDDTVLTEEEAKLRREKLKQLIKLGKTRGYLTHAEINDHLPDKLVEQETLEVVVSLLNDMGVAVYEQTPDAETLLLTGAPTAVTTEEEAEGRSRSRAVHRGQRIWPHHRPRAHVHARNGLGGVAHARGRDRDRQAH
jgi:RNA polymerase primary sigma factor